MPTAVLATSKEQKTTIETHPVRDYVRDERVNRFMSPARVEKLRANLNLEAIGVLTVSKRENGDLIILDGAHRVTALMEEGFGGLKVPANVHSNLSRAEEAALFLLYNDRLAVDILERFRLQVAAEDPEALILDREIRAAGFLPVTGHRNRLTAIKTLQTVYRGGSSTGRETHLKTLRDTLRIIGEAWGVEGTAVKQTMLGIGGLLLSHGDSVDQKHLVDELAKLRGGANAIVVKAHYHTQEGGKRAMPAAELAVVEIYNRNLKAAEKLKNAN